MLIAVDVDEVLADFISFYYEYTWGGSQEEAIRKTKLPATSKRVKNWPELTKHLQDSLFL